MSAGVKFLFDTDFSSGAKPHVATVSLAQYEAAVAEAEARGHRNGLAAGRAEGAAETARKLSAALAKAASSMEALVKSLDAVQSRLEQEAIEVAVAVAGKLAPELIAREPLAEVESLVTECFRHVVSAPHVVVRIADALYEDACGRLKEIAERSSFAGRLIVLADPEIAVGDCRIEWADGGAMRDRPGLERAIAEAVDRYLVSRAGRQAAGEVRSRAS